MDEMGTLLEQAVRVGLLSPSDTPKHWKSSMNSHPFELLKKKHPDDTWSLLVEWFTSDAGQHEPSCGKEVKGDLLRWENFGGTKVPTIRKDYVDSLLADKIIVRGTTNLMDFIADRLD